MLLEEAARFLDSLRPVLLSREDLEAALLRFCEARPTEWAHEEDLGAEEAAWVEESFSPGGRVLVLFAGGGREMLALGRRGYRVEGVEWVEAAARRARERLAAAGIDAQVHAVDVRRADLPAGAFDAATALGITYGMIPGRDARVAVLARVRKWLRPGGRLLLDALAAKPGPRERRLFPLRRALARLLGGNREFQLGDRPWPGGGFMHHFDGPEEIGAEAAAAGLREIRRATDGAGALRMLFERPASGAPTSPAGE